jgi:hypothetical protein
MIAIDFSMLSQNRLPRCAYQLANLAEIADRMHLSVKVIATDNQLAKMPILRRVEHLISNDYTDVTLYIAKSDTFYFDRNWRNIENLLAYKVCLSSSDRVFRERDGSWKGESGGAVQNRCDLYMPVNCTPQLLQSHGHKTIPVAHRTSTQVFDLFAKMGLDYAYLDDDVQTIRDAFTVENIGLAGFMGRSGYGERRNTSGMPTWVNLLWVAGASAHQYIKNLLSYTACVDLRGAGDKSLRFIEAVIFGRTIITRQQRSPYLPPLIDGHNAIIVKEWSELDSRVDLPLWQSVVEQATKDYLTHWSQLAQFKMILERAGYDQHSA